MIDFNRMNTYRGMLLLAFPFFVACAGDGKTDVPLDTTSSGAIAIAVDETFEPIIQAELDVFHALYPKANITPRYKPEGEAIHDLIVDSARIAIVTRELTEDELKPFKANNLIVRTTKFAVDAIALIIHPSNMDSILSMAGVRDVFSAKAMKWNDLNKASKNTGEITVVFDNPASSTVRYMKTVAGVDKFSSKNFFAVRTNQEVIEYVSKNKNAIGVIGANWVSDTDDEKVIGFLNKIRVVALAPDAGQPGEGEYRKPYQAYVAQGFYPLARRVYILSREARAGLGTGFSAFIAGDKGQRIVMKSGLLPATVPVRIIKLSEKKLY